MYLKRVGEDEFFYQIGGKLYYCESSLRFFVMERNREIIFVDIYFKLPVPMDARSKARTVFGRSNTGIVGSNPARGMDVCPRFSVLCFPV
jgi:hypothetical protein